MVTQYPNTGSTLLGPDGINKTSTALSTNIIIRVNGTPVGAIQSLGVTETRAVRTIPEVGTDGFIDSSPSSSTTIAVTCTRIRFDKLRVAQAFSRDFIHAASQRYPFDIEIYDTQSEAESNRIVTIIKNCWITSISYTYSATDWIISENMNCQAETIYSFVSNSGKPVAEINTPRLVTTFNDPIERATDKGDRRGSLDAAGLIDLSGDRF